MVFIFLVFCVVVFGGVRGAHLFSFLCCGIWWGPLSSSFFFSLLYFVVGCVVLIFLVFCVVVFGGVRGAHLFSFLCCGIWWGPWCSSF